MLDKFDEVLDKQVRPYLRQHHGDIEVVDFKDGVLTVRMLGGCSCCPGVQVTVEEVVAKELKKRFSFIKKVEVAAHEMDPEVWAFAKQILNRNKAQQQ